MPVVTGISPAVSAFQGVATANVIYLRHEVIERRAIYAHLRDFVPGIRQFG